MITSKIYDIIWLRYQKFFEIIRKKPCTLPVISEVPWYFLQFHRKCVNIFWYCIWYHIWFLARKAKTPMISYFFVISYMISYQKVWYHIWYYEYHIWQERLSQWYHVQFHNICWISYTISYMISYMILRILHDIIYDIWQHGDIIYDIIHIYIYMPFSLIYRMISAA